jgi:hypothetical protein
MLTPPDTRSNTQRIYVPRTAIASLEVAGVIGLAAKPRAAAPAEQPQSGILPFEPAAEAEQ